ncbi:MAG: DUF4190 domain-containing protein [Kineosporiaceae bacterium]|nr:DUF4190 domain-containing protein [Aeromicrobium sp.]
MSFTSAHSNAALSALLPPPVTAEHAGEAVTQPIALKTNVFAVISLAGSLVVALVGIVFGHLALAQIKITGESGRNMAIGGLVVGYVSLAFGLIIGVIYTVGTVAMFGAVSNGNDMGLSGW